MPFRHRTNSKPRKLRCTTLACLGLLVAGGCSFTAQDALGSSSRTSTENVTVTSFPVSPQLVATAAVGGNLQIPTLAPAPDGSNAEWMVVSGGRQDLISITPTGQQKMVQLSAFQADNGPPDTYVSVDADGFDWVLDNDQGAPEDNLYAVGAPSSESPGVNPVATFNGYAEDMTLGSDGALYVTDNAGNIIRCQITAVPSATCSRTPLNDAFDGGGYAVGAGAGLTWFTDATGELGAIDSQDNVSGPYADTGTGVGALSIDPGTIVGAANGAVYAAGGAESEASGNDEILGALATSPDSLHVIASGLSNVVAITTGPDGNLWFLDAGAFNGAGAVGTLNITTNAVNEYPLPAGVVIPSAARIATGPDVADANGYGDVFFSATSAATSGPGITGNALVGEVTGIPLPIVAGTMALQPSVTVSRQRLALLSLACAGEGNAECTGKLKFNVTARYKVATKTTVRYKVRVRIRVKVKVRIKNRPGGQPAGPARAKFRFKTETKTRTETRTRIQTTVRMHTARLSLGSVSYSLRGAKTLTARLKLSNAEYKVLEQVTGHKWSASVAVASKLGTVTGRALTMVGPQP
jgi:streptogramin lyase